VKEFELVNYFQWVSSFKDVNIFLFNCILGINCAFFETSNDLGPLNEFIGNLFSYGGDSCEYELKVNVFFFKMYI